MSAFKRLRPVTIFSLPNLNDNGRKYPVIKLKRTSVRQFRIGKFLNFMIFNQLLYPLSEILINLPRDWLRHMHHIVLNWHESILPRDLLKSISE